MSNHNKIGSRSSFSVKPLTGGIGTEQNCLTDCKNLWVKDGLLATRPGFTPLTTDIPFQAGAYDLVWGLKPTDTYFTAGGVRYRIWDYSDTDGQSVLRLHPLPMAADGSILTVTPLQLNRTSETVFYQPQQRFYLSAAATYGCGLYVFLTLTATGCDPTYVVYELSSDYGSWREIAESDFYRPVIYKNGRGTQYDEAAKLSAVCENRPTVPESRNRLCGSFYAYFSSDGKSSTFILPVSRLDAKPIVCRIYRSETEYTEWTIQSSGISATATFLGTEVLMTCDRTTGILRFFDTATNSYAIPLITKFNSNNIRISASKTIPNGKASIVGAGCALTVGNRVFVGGAATTPDTVCSARVDCPLYFPEESVLALGPAAGTVRRFCTQNNLPIALCSGQIAVLTQTAGTKVPQTDILVGAADSCITADRLQVRQRYNIGVFGTGSAAASCNGRLIFLAADRTVRMLRFGHAAYENRPTVLSEAISDLLQAADFTAVPFACEWQGCWILFYGRKILLAHTENLTDTNPYAAWFAWQMPTGIDYTGACSIGRNLRIGSKIPGGLAAYFGDLSGDTDGVYCRQSGSFRVVTQPIEYSFQTVRYDLGLPFEEKLVDALYLTAATAEPLAIDCGGRHFARPLSPAAIADGSLQALHLRPFLRFARTVCFAASGWGDARFGGFTFSFRSFGTAP